jgi:hypothetical protein
MKAMKLMLINLLLLAGAAQAQELVIDNFIIKENLLKNEQIAVIAQDKDGNNENINGTYVFGINGFREDLQFNNGVAVAPRQINKSTFVFLKHTNDAGTHTRLYYVLKRGSDLHPLKINWIILLAVPLVLIALAMLFRKFIIISLILLAIIFFFYYSKGLDLPAFFETIYYGIRSVF